MESNTEVICYIIITTHGTYYTGITNSLIRRWSEHLYYRSSYLSKFRPLEVVYVAVFDNRKAARKNEVLIKSIGAKKYLLKLKYRL